jgi:hypothetical protein
MKKTYIVDAVFIILLGIVLTVISEIGVDIKIGFLYIPFLICYYIGRYASYYFYKAR